MQDASLQFEIKASTAKLCFSRPHVHNAIDRHTLDEFAQALDQIDADSRIHQIIITGSGDRTFCAGADLRECATMRDETAWNASATRMSALLDRLYYGTRPVIAAINGQAFGGGCEIITACHLRIAVDTAQFAFRHATIGMTTGWGGGARLLRQLPRIDALKLLLTGQPVSAQEAQRIGFIHEVVSPSEFQTTIDRYVEILSQNSRGSLGGFLQLAREVDLGTADTVARLERELFCERWNASEFSKTLERFNCT